MVKARSSTELVERNNLKFSLALPVQSPGPCFLHQSACFPFRSPHSGPTTLRPPAPFVPCHILSPTATMCVCVLESMCVCACLHLPLSLSLSRARARALSLCKMCLSIRKTVRRGCARTASELAGESERESERAREQASERQREQERDLPE